MNWGTTTTIPQGPEKPTDHWSYYGKTPLEAIARQNAGAAPMSQADWSAMHAPAPQAAPAYEPQATGPGAAVFGASQPANPYVPQQQAIPQQQRPMQAQAQPAQPAQPSGQTQNPYLPQMADEITRRASTQFNQQINPSINRAAVANGGYGGSRQGIAQGLAMSQGMDNIAGQLTNLYGTQFNADRNYGLQSDALDLNVYNANQNWMNQGAQNQLGALNTMLGWNQNYGIGNATGVQNTPLNYWQQFANTGAQLGGLGGSQTQNLQGNPYLGALGGALTGAQLWKAWGG